MVIAVKSLARTEWPLHVIIVECCEAMMRPLLARVRRGTRDSMAVIIEDAWLAREVVCGGDDGVYVST